MSNDAFNERLARLGASAAPAAPAPVATVTGPAPHRASGYRGPIIAAALLFGLVILGSAAAVAFPQLVVDVIESVSP